MVAHMPWAGPQMGGRNSAPDVHARDALEELLFPRDLLVGQLGHGFHLSLGPIRSNDRQAVRVSAAYYSQTNPPSPAYRQVSRPSGFAGKKRERPPAINDRFDCASMASKHHAPDRALARIRRHPMKILAIVGSLRQGKLQPANSPKQQGTVLAKNCIPMWSFEILDWADVPLMNQDIEHPAPERRRPREGKGQAGRRASGCSAPNTTISSPVRSKTCSTGSRAPSANRKARCWPGQALSHSPAPSHRDERNRACAGPPRVRCSAFLQARHHERSRGSPFPISDSQMDGRQAFALDASAPYLEKPSGRLSSRFIERRQAL